MVAMTDTVESVLAEMRRGGGTETGWIAIHTARDWADRLAAAHAREVGELREDVNRLARARMQDRERIAEIEVACAQAVEFAQYVEDAAKGAMVERAQHFLSLPYSQELASRLTRAEAAECLLRDALPFIGWCGPDGGIKARINAHLSGEAGKP